MDKNEVVPKTKMALSEIMTIVIMYHLSGCRTFKWYHTKHIMKYQKQDYPTLVSYNHFVEIMRYAFVPLLLYTIRGRFGKYSDRGYISQKLFEKLMERDITLVIRAKKNMKNKLIDLYDRDLYDRFMLRKRTVIESVNDFLKNICDIEHSKHRSITNFLMNLLSALAAYSLLSKKPFICSNSDTSKDILCFLD